jgi:phospholipid-binding lipoprotein MlaA
MNAPDISRPVLRAACLAVLALALTGCATGPDRRDPLENFNRGVSRFNDELDAAVLKPVASAYQDHVPAPARKAVGNVFSNLGDVWSMVNSALQFKMQHAAESLMRVSVNTVFGFYGVLDIATEAGIERHREDFGQTLATWGVPSGPYLVLPVLGPSTLRDASALAVDRQGDLVREIDPAGARNASYALRAVDARASVLRAGRLIDEVALDRYTFTRDAYLQRRRAEIFEGEPPKLPDDPKDE